MFRDANQDGISDFKGSNGIEIIVESFLFFRLLSVSKRNWASFNSVDERQMASRPIFVISIRNPAWTTIFKI
jgi:hypothetical protein